MPQIIPIKELKNTSEISEMCHKTENPIFITKNGYGDMVIMSIETYERSMAYLEKIYESLERSETQMNTWKSENGLEHIRKVKEKQGL